MSIVPSGYAPDVFPFVGNKGGSLVNNVNREGRFRDGVYERDGADIEFYKIGEDRECAEQVREGSDVEEETGCDWR